MLDTELRDRLEQLLRKQPNGRALAARLTVQIRDQLAPVARSATRIAQSKLSGVGAGRPGRLADLAAGAGSQTVTATAASGAAIGQAVIPIPVVGAAVGAVVGAVYGFLAGNKHYLDVNSANSEEDQDVLDIWPQYRKVAGTVAGRDFGLPLLERVWKGAVYSQSDFPQNNKRLCFHAGCFKYPGDPGWIHGAIYGGAGTGNFTFPAAIAQVGGNLDPRVIAQQFIVNNQADRPPWAVPTTAAGQQLLVDIADALIGARGAPYFYGQPQVSAALPQQIAPAAPTQPLTPPSVVPPPPAPFEALPAPAVVTTPGTSAEALLRRFLEQNGISATSPGGRALIRDVANQGVTRTQAGIGAGLPTWALAGMALVAVGMAASAPRARKAAA